jgi:hypothetical protein
MDELVRAKQLDTKGIHGSGFDKPDAADVQAMFRPDIFSSGQLSVTGTVSTFAAGGYRRASFLGMRAVW